MIYQRKKTLIGVKWVYNKKLNEKGEIDIFKVRPVAKGFSHPPRIDFGEMFAPVSHIRYCKRSSIHNISKQVEIISNGYEINLLE